MSVETRRGGWSLEDVSAFEAARAQGFPEPEILQAFGLDAGRKAAALAQWKITLASDAALLAAYEAALARAEDKLTRRVPPLDEDLEAWVAFLGAYAAHPAPFELLRGLGLALPDLSRLGRLWARRLAAAPRLREQASRLAREDHPRALPTVRPAEAVLVPPKPGLPPPLRPSLTLEQHASLTVELAMAPERRAEILARYRITPEQKDPLDRHYERLTQEDPEKRAAWHAAYRAYHAWLISTGPRP